MITQNTFNDGMLKDLNPLTTPNTVLTDALNATLITYNGVEFVLQNDMGNCKVERAKLAPGFIPLGMKEYGGIVYIASYNPETRMGELGAFPSPERDFSTRDFENLSPAKFTTDKFVVNTGTPVNEKTSYIQKLVEPELLQLNPGDMYVVTFIIHNPVPGSSLPNEIEDVADMNAYISKDLTDRKLFKLKFYKITDDNNLSDMDPDSIKVIEDQPDIEDEYVFFKENSKGTIAVGLELEGLDQFDINVIDTSKVTDATKSAVIEAIGYSDSLADFEGIKVEISEPEFETFYVNKTGSLKKVSARVSDLAEDSKFIGKITPYSKYALYPKLSKDFNLELGKFAYAGSGVNDIFKYYIDKNFVRLDFDFKFQGDNSNGLVLYVEFYDPWSDYSIIKVVDNPTYYGINSVQMELIDEPAIDVFNSITQGGTPITQLIPNSDTTFQKSLLNTSGLIRTTSTLRKNHFYIVRISGVDIDYSGATPDYVHYDLYKGLYTNTLLNNTYILQNSISPSDPGFVADFNTIDFKIEDLVKYTSVIKESAPLYVKSDLIHIEDGVNVTGNKYYTIVDSPTIGGYYKAGYNFTKTTNTDIDLTLNGKEFIFGSLKNGIVNLSFPNIDPAEGAVDPSLVPKVEDVGYDSDPNINPTSTAIWRLQASNPLSYRLRKTLSTNRYVYGAKVQYLLPGGFDVTKVIRKNIPVEQRFQGMEGTAVNFTARHVYIGASDYLTCKTDKLDNGKFNAIVNTQFGSTKPVLVFARGTALAAGDFPNSCQYNTYANGRYILMRFDDGMRIDGQTYAWVRRPGEYFPTLISDDKRDILRAASKEFRIHSAAEQKVYVYYPDNNNIKANSTITTTGTFENLYYTITYTPISGKTYLSTFRFKATNSIVDFSTSVLNNYIATRKGNSVIVDDKDTLNDGFIPYIDTVSSANTPVVTAPIVITESAASSLVTAFSDAHNLWSSDPIFTVNNTYTHGQLFSQNPAYNDLLKLFAVGNVTDGVEITESNFELYGAVPSTTPGQWAGVKSNGSVQGDEKNYLTRINLKVDI